MDLKLDDGHKKDLLLTEMKKSDTLKLKMEKYGDLPEEKQTYAALLEVFRKFLQDEKSDQNLKKEKLAAAKAGPAGGNVNANQQQLPCQICAVVGHTALNCPSKGKGLKGPGKGSPKGGSKGGGGKSPRQSESPRKSPLCYWHQTKYNGGHRCSNGKDCKFAHDPTCKNQAEFDALPKPWGKTTPRDSPRKGDRKGNKSKGSPKGGGADGSAAAAVEPPPQKVFMVDANWNTFCRKFMDCPGAKDGKCKKLHTTKEEAEKVVKSWKAGNAAAGNSK